MRFILISFCSVKQFYGASFVMRKRSRGGAAVLEIKRRYFLQQ